MLYISVKQSLKEAKYYSVRPMFKPRRLDSGLLNFLVTLRFSFMGMYKSYCKCWKIKMCQHFSKKYFNKKIISIKLTLYSICSNLEI